MFYRPGIEPHELPHNPFKALIAPRPIGWISTLDKEGRANLAPYSFFNAVSEDPPILFFSSQYKKLGKDERKDSLQNIKDTGEFVHNVVGDAFRDEMNLSSGTYPAGEDEFAIAGLEKAPSELVKPPRIANAPAAMECRLHQIVDLPGEYTMVLGEVVGIHINEDFLRNGMFDIEQVKPLARLGYRDYTRVDTLFSLNRPGQR